MVQMLDFKKLAEQISSNSASKLGLRNELKQNRNFGKRIPKLRKEAKKRCKIMIVREIAIPFNPETGEADDMFSPDRKWRTTLSATTTALYLKNLCNENEVAKEAFMRRAGLTDWDTSDVGQLNEADKKVFGKYLVIRTFTVPTVNISIPAMTKNEGGRNYIVKVDRDPYTGEIIGKEPLWSRVNGLMRAVAFEEVSEYEEAITARKIDHTEEQQKQRKRDIYQKICVSSEQPSNFLFAIELPLDNTYRLACEMHGIAASDVEARAVLINRNKKIGEALGKYTDGSYVMFDKYFDFLELDMACPSDTNADDKTIGQNTTFEKPTLSLYQDPNYEDFVAATREYLDTAENLEEVVMASIRYRLYDDTVEAQLLSALDSVITPDGKYYTQRVLENYSDVISLVTGGADLLMEQEAGISDKDSGRFDAGKSAEKATEFSIETDDVDLDSDLD